MKSDRLTETGRKMARLPVDPRIARMIIEVGPPGLRPRSPGHRRRAVHPGPARAPRGQPAGRRHRAPPLRPAGIGLPRLPRAVGLPRRPPARAVRLRLPPHVPRRVPQLPAGPRVAGPARPAAKPVRDLGLSTKSSSSERVRVHTALLAGLLSHVGMKVVLTRPAAARPRAERGRRPLPEYLGARGTRFAVFPGSALARKPPDWVVAAELVETSRLWGRIVAAIEPEWVEPVAAHLVKRSYSEPRWSKSRGAVDRHGEGHPLRHPDRRRPHGELRTASTRCSRELFIRHALVEGDWETRHHFFRDNATLLDEAAELEQRARRRGLVAGEDALFEFYDARVPADVTSARHFDAWWKKAAPPDALTCSRSPSMTCSARRRRRAGLRRLPRGLDLGDAARPRQASEPCRCPTPSSPAGNRRRHHRHPAQAP